jgi:hypothetical protein
MSNALAIAGVTAVLKDLLNNGLIDHNVTGAVGGNVTVTALPPDRVIAAGAQEGNQLNLFLHQVTPNPGWRNAGLPSRDERGERLTNPPLAVDLHYLLTAYGAEDLHAEILLGYAMQLLHETPILSRQAIRTALVPSSLNATILPPALQALSAADLAEQVEQIKVSPATFNSEEMSKLWSALQARYRPTAAYQVSVVLIESQKGAKSALPVLTRGAVDATTQRERGVSVQGQLTAPFPTITSVIVPDRQPSAQLGETLTLEGHHLEGVNARVRFSNARLPAALEVPPLAGGTATRLQVTVPNDPAQWVAGLYTVAAQVQRPGETSQRTTNELSLSLAPSIATPLPLSVGRDANGDATITVTCRPEVRPQQRVVLIMGDREIAAQPHPSQTNSLSFLVKKATPGTSFIRLRVDGVDSALVNRAVSPPVFLNHTVTITP